jgi:hypothetical protein
MRKMLILVYCLADMSLGNSAGLADPRRLETVLM